MVQLHSRLPLELYCSLIIWGPILIPKHSSLHSQAKNSFEYPSRIASISPCSLLHYSFLWCIGVVNYRFIPSFIQYSLNSHEVNSPPRYVLKHLFSKPVSFSTHFLKYLKESNAPDFSSREFTHTFLEKSSTKKIIYFLCLLKMD
jgi:hypothetical protein